MPKKKGAHLSFDDRCEIEDMLKEGSSFREIARKLEISPTTVSNEVKLNRVFFKPKAMPAKAQSRCSKYQNCTEVALCPVCSSHAAACKRCGKKRCWDICKKFDPYACERRERAPFVCTTCKKRAYCTLEKARYVASKAQAAHDTRLSAAHAGIACGPDELKDMVDKVKKLLSQGQSLQAIWIAHKGEFPVCERTFYNYMDKGVMGLANIELPKKVTYAPRKKKAKGAFKMDLAGRTYADWLELPDEKRTLTVQIDCVEGLRCNSKCILSLHFVRLFFQLYILIENQDQAHVKAALDAVEAYCEGNFSNVFPILLGDRGSEFLDFTKIEVGLDGSRRTRMFYCDPVKPGQKGACEKNHVELRKVLPKGTDFDALTFDDVAEVCSHVNSYPRPGQGAAPIQLASLVLPANLLESLGVRAVAPDDVIMTPKLLGL